jgi:hypothetical protein
MPSTGFLDRLVASLGAMTTLETTLKACCSRRNDLERADIAPPKRGL